MAGIFSQAGSILSKLRLPRNLADYRNSPVPAMSPGKWLTLQHDTDVMD
jgi:hypothetical protein